MLRMFEIVGSIVVVYFGVRVIATACDPLVWRLMRAQPTVFFRAVLLAFLRRLMIGPEDSK